MAKQAKTTKAPKAPVTPVAPVAPTRTRGRAYTPTDVITVVTGEGARRVVKSLACDRTLSAIASTKSRTVAEYLAAFGPACEKQPLPGRGGQPGATQASAILRFLEREGAVVVAAKGATK